ncbi:MAG: indolepyruvate ferredoxin oxidoreductase family protein [Myxococcota bacterium]|nr:indolepyruvate ferredoxin oxidoreductase family protein [Myxococcota bacterium]
MTSSVDEQYALEDRYRRRSGRVYLTGVQALVRLPLDQRARDEAAGLSTAGFISGYRGSPLGTYDMALWQARAELEAAGVRFEPGVNEDLAATAVWGSQQAGLLPGARQDGVFGIWYGKGPGVDRSCDALKHANYAGTAPNGGVLALTGDDPGAKSSSIAHQSEHALIHCGIPVLNPSSVQEYLDLGLHGFALSRFAGCWVGFKCLTDTVDSAASVDVDPDRVRVVLPEDVERPEGLHIGWQNIPLQVEARLYQQRLPLAQAYVRANGLDRTALASERPRLGIVTTGKAYLDVRQALEDLGLDEARASALGLCIYKVAMPWPLEPEGLRAFASGLEDLLVVEEKRPILEEPIARALYNLQDRPRLLGKRDEDGAPLLPSEGELSPSVVAEALRSWIARRDPEAARQLRPPPAPPAAASPGKLRLPAFCSGCPHNTSTVVPEGSSALGGIGCHGMAVWLPGRNTLAVTQMGGEGANWIGMAPFTDTEHLFQNIGDGTYFHSGLLAIRAAVTAGVDITYKVLVNGAVAMTGGQPIEGEVLEGEVTVPAVVKQLRAEGVERIAVVGPEPDKYARGEVSGPGVTRHHRDEIDAVQRELRTVRGVSALVYDQTCAAEARRLRRQNAFPDPDRRILIHEGVCEGCGDCSVQSNCISIEPVETELGRKRRINQSSCNKDFTCVKGYCPSFVSVLGGRVRKAETQEADDGGRFASLPLPESAPCDEPFNVLLAGIGGSGVVTSGAILAVAAHLEGKGCSELDVTGLSQKNGPVASHVRIANDPERIFATRVAAGAADVVLGCDLVVATSFENLPRIGKERTTAVMNSSVSPTADFAGDPDLDLSPAPLEQAVRQAAGDEGAHFVPFSEWATALLGDAIAANLMMLGYAFQLGRLPTGLRALTRAIELNGRSVERNLRAFEWGRLAAHDRAAVESVVAPLLRGSAAAPRAETLDEVIAFREQHLLAYQGPALVKRYRALVDRAREAEARVGREGLALATARGFHKLLAIKDEYEVARLFTDGSLEEQLGREFEGDYRLQLHLSPQFLPSWLVPADARTGRKAKWTLGPWMLRVFGVLRHLRFLRGTPLDVCGWPEHRKRERALIGEYERTLGDLLARLDADRFDTSVEIASLPEGIRGYDTVKDESIAEAKQREAELLEKLR